MNAIPLWGKLLDNLNANLHRIVGDLTADEWLARPVAGQNMLGYTAWHMPRTQDSHIQTWVRGIPEVAHGMRWARWHSLIKRCGNGVGISLDEADEIARNTHSVDVLEYADAVHREILAWLKALSADDLDRTPNYKLHLARYPEYQTPGFLKESSDLLDQPIWGQLIRPCLGHIHRHLGEIEMAKKLLRANK